MRCSSYTVLHPLDGCSTVLLVQGAVGAVDLAPTDIGRRLTGMASTDAREAAGEDPLSEGLERTLKERGYLTERSEAEEICHVERILSAYAKRVRSRVDLQLNLRPDLLADDEAARRAERHFELLTELFRGRADRGELATVRIVIAESRGQPGNRCSAALDQLMEQAAIADIDVELKIAVEHLDLLQKHLENNYLARLTIDLPLPNGGVPEEALLSTTQSAILSGKQAHWMVHSDDLEKAEIRRIVSLRALLGARLSKANMAQLKNLLIVPLLSREENRKLAVQVADEDLPVLRQLYFHASPSAVRGGALGFAAVSLPPTLKVSYSPAQELQVRIGEQQEVWDLRAFEENPAEHLEQLTERVQNLYSTMTASRKELRMRCGSKCPYSLICDGICAPLQKEGTPVRPLGDYPERLRRVLPALTVNVSFEARDNERH